jgi:small subunit ribosomal protein S1
MRRFIRRSDLSRDRSEQRPERFSVGDKVDARVTNIDRGSRRVTLSIKALEIAEEKEAVAQYGSADSGASLGDILGAALGGSVPAAEETPAIKGLGKVFAGKLNEAGITTFAQMAALTAEEVATLEEKLNVSGKFEKEDWVAQAKAFAS